MMDPAGCPLFAAIILEQDSAPQAVRCGCACGDEAAVQQLTSQTLLVVSQAPASCCCAAFDHAPRLHFQCEPKGAVTAPQPARGCC